MSKKKRKHKVRAVNPSPDEEVPAPSVASPSDNGYSQTEIRKLKSRLLK